ncbi:MAG: hypothetical protein ACXAB2_08505 [Candidatus Hodarchaeales archaeon]|jgi:hypothetical protein
MADNECQGLVAEANNAVDHSLKIASKLYEDAAKCFDRKGDRVKAGQSLTIAGDFYLELNKMDKAATCYGKAIVRHLMADDIETAKILVHKGTDYGFTSATYQFKMALNAFERKKDSIDLESGLISEEEESIASEKEKLPEIDILPVEEENDIVVFDTAILENDLNIDVQQNHFIIPQLEEEDPSKMSSFSVLAAISNSTRKKVERSIKTDAIFKDQKGETKIISPKFTFTPIQEESEITVLSTEKPEKEVHKEVVQENEDLIPNNVEKTLQNTDTLDLDYSARTEIVNEYEEELYDIEVVDTIPYQWQVVDISSNFELDQRKQTDEGTVFTWKTDHLKAGKKATVEYILRKRIERSIIIRKNNQVSVLNLYHSLHQNLEAHLDFVNTSGETFQEVLCEDIIPPELIVREVNSQQNFRPVTIPTPDSTLYRWIFSRLPPGDNFSVDYTFNEKPLTRHYQNSVETDEGIIEYEKISQPIIDSFGYEYVWIYTINNPTKFSMTLKDRIPYNFEILLVDPLFLRPMPSKEKTATVLTWELNFPEKKTFFLIRIKGNESFTPLSPEIIIEGISEIQLIDTETESKKSLIDIRQIKKNFQELT